MPHLTRLTWILSISVALLLILAATIGVLRLRTTAPTSFSECVAAGNPVMESYPRQCRSGDVTFVEEIPSPDVSLDTPSLSASGNMRVDEPRADAVISSPLVVTGMARVFENTVEWKLTDAAGLTLTSGFVTADSGEVGSMTPFRIEKAFTTPRASSGFLEVFSTSARDGSVIDLVRLPVRFSAQTRTVTVFFSDTRRDPQTLSCETTYPVERSIPVTPAPARAALEQLLSGTTREEVLRGFVSNIPDNVRILSLVIDGDTALVNFSTELRSAGSCRITAIRSQIENTLLQFPTIKSVEIRIEGMKDALQP